MFNAAKELIAPVDILNPVLPPIGRVDSVCPSCSTALAKRPGRKIACPACGESILVRTRPYTGERVLVTEQDACRIEAQWSLRGELTGVSPEYAALYNSARLRLQSGFGRPPTHHEVLLLIHGAEARDASSRGNWFQYAHCKRKIANLLFDDGHVAESMDTWLEAVALNINGASDVERHANDRQLLREFPPFDKSRSGLLLETLCETIEPIRDALGLDIETLGERFVRVWQERLASFPLPFGTEKGKTLFLQAMRKMAKCTR